MGKWLYSSRKHTRMLSFQSEVLNLTKQDSNRKKSKAMGRTQEIINKNLQFTIRKQWMWNLMLLLLTKRINIQCNGWNGEQQHVCLSKAVRDATSVQGNSAQQYHGNGYDVEFTWMISINVIIRRAEWPLEKAAR